MNKIEELAYRNSHTKQRRIVNVSVFGLIILFSLGTAIPLFSILFELIGKGSHQINLDFFTQVVPSSVDAMLAKQKGQPIPGGILNGITGTLMMVGLASLFSIPMGLFGGIYLSKNRDKKMASLVRSLADILQGVPSIICGILVYMWVVTTLHSFSALAGAAALSIMMIPMISRSTEEALNMLPNTIMEAGLALGGSYTSVMFRILLPSAFGAVFTGILLSISRVMGETAPLMVTALGATYINWNPTSPTSAVSLLIWEFYNDPNLVDLIWSTALLLMILILCLNLLAKYMSARWRIN